MMQLQAKSFICYIIIVGGGVWGGGGVHAGGSVGCICALEVKL